MIISLQIKFVTPVYHPAIKDDGNICKIVIILTWTNLFGFLSRFGSSWGKMDTEFVYRYQYESIFSF